MALMGIVAIPPTFSAHASKIISNSYTISLAISKGTSKDTATCASRQRLILGLSRKAKRTSNGGSAIKPLTITS